MIIRNAQEIPAADVPGYGGVKKRIVLGPDDGSAEIVLRQFTLAPGTSTPHHAHGFPHLVKVEAGAGVVADAGGAEHPLRAGDFVYVADNEIHHFSNTGPEPFEFLCIVPRRGEA